jgi:hypothetical protein
MCPLPPSLNPFRVGWLTCAALQLTILEEFMMQLAGNALAPSTQTGYRSQCKIYIRFCLFIGRAIMPADDTTLALFCSWLSQTCKPSTIKGYLSGVRSMHVCSGLSWTTLKDRHLVQQVLQGLRRCMGSEPSRKLPITPDLLLAIYRVLEPTVEDQAWWAAVLTAFFLMLRKDNVSIAKEEAFNPRTALLKSDLLLPEGFTWNSPNIPVVWVRLRHSKTNQFHARTHTVPVVATGGPLCPVTAIQRVMWVNQFAPMDTHAFATPQAGAGGTHFAPLLHSTFVQRTKDYLKMIGVNPKNYAGHSFRRGGATFGCKIAPGDHTLVKWVGDWLSDTYLMYNELDTESMLKLPRMMAAAVVNLCKR